MAETAARARPFPELPPPASYLPWMVGSVFLSDLADAFPGARSALRATILPGDRYALGGTG